MLTRHSTVGGSGGTTEGKGQPQKTRDHLNFSEDDITLNM